MSGDVQPRKRKDKKRKKDDLGVEEPRGTAAALGEGDVFMHSQHEHGTGGHWCAKIIFFSLLAVLITLIGLIILENRGLSELEANAVESRYSGVLEGWLEDAPDDDHHDEHTLELTHHDDDEEHHEANHLEDENHDEAEDDDHDEDHDEDEDNDQDDDERIKQSDEDDDDDDEELNNDENDGDDDEYVLDKDEDNEQQDLDDEDEEHDFYSDKKKTIYDESEDNGNKDDLNDGDESGEENQPDDEDNEDSHEENYYGQYEVDENDRDHIDDDDDESNEIDNAKYENSIENNDDDDNDQNLEDSNENNNEDDEEHEEDHDSAEEEVEVEKLELEEPDEEAISTELPSLPEDNDDDNGVTDDKNDDGDLSEAESDQEEFDNAEEEDEYLENDDIEEPEVEPITALPGKPLPEVEEEISSEQPPDTLAEEEEYEKRQEELRREEEQSSHMWLKLTVGGALLVATHAVMRRATRSRDALDDEEPAITEDIPLSDRRLTLIPEEHSKSVPVKKILEEISERSFDKVVGSADNSGKPALVKKQESEDEEKYSDEEEIQDSTVTAEDNKELYSDDEQPEDDEEIVKEPKQIINQSAPLVESKATHEPEGDEELEEDDVEIIDDEQLEEELEEEDEEEISDVDDAELLTRLEAKYGKLPEPERPGQKHYKDGGNSIDDVWPGEPSDAYWRDQLDSAEKDLLQRASSDRLRDSARARWIAARALDHAAEARRDNSLLSRAITAYLHLLKMNERLSDEKLLKISERVLDRIQFRGNYLNAEPVYRLLIRRFPNDPAYRNNLTISYLMANRADLAEDSIKETLKRWPNDRLALAHYGFVLKTRHNRYEEAAQAFSKALDGDTGPANEARFYYHYGDSLLLLGRFAEAHEVHKRGAALGHFLSPAQRSLYNVPRLKSSPWWKIEETPYLNLAKALEKSWREILKEAEAAKSLYEKEKEGLKERGEWSQLDLFARGREIPDRCKRAPVTCSIVKGEIAAVGCRRGQIKFSAMEAGTHVRPHVGPTNCRLRMHLGLSNTKDTYIRVDQELRQWREGKTLMFDDSFEHEVWHNGTGTRLVLIVDVWHPHLTPAERRQLPAI